MGNVYNIMLLIILNYISNNMSRRTEIYQNVKSDHLMVMMGDFFLPTFMFLIIFFCSECI